MRRQLASGIAPLMMIGVCTKAADTTITVGEADPGRLAVLDGDGSSITSRSSDVA